MKKTTVIIDIDGCLADYRLGLLYWIRQSVPEFSHMANKHLKVEDTWIDADSMNMTYEKWLDVLERFRMSGGKRSIPVFPGAKELLTVCREKGLEIVLLTSRPIDICSNIYGDTLQWLQDNQLPFDILHWSRSKAELVHKMRLHKKTLFALDDEIKHIQDYYRLGLPVVHIDLYKNSYPEGLSLKPEGYRVYNSMLEFVEVFKNEQS